MIRILAVLVLLSIPLLWALGCGEARPPAPVPEPGPFADLASLGSTLIWVGGISAAAGAAVRVVALFYPPLAWLGGLAGFAGIGGSAVAVVGAACSYLAANPGLVLAIALAALVAVGWWYWPRLRRALDRRLEGKA